MLELRNITKNYHAGTETVRALRGVSLSFRKSEFVAILGPSGCGKTTMLNIIGGLDQYTDGDLIINGRSTKLFKDRDWDSYRNHSVGFVFQSYNLIPHQTVLSNVELALTLSGVRRSERRERAKKALEEVGLGNQLSKRPNEMSGGQMQRVAIARAIVNNPDIILADEPTGALDTETGIQVMEILRKISEKRLVIMVTHNPDLAARYATRTITMLDGRITGDSMPITGAESTEADKPAPKAAKHKAEKKPSMSLFTSFGLSLNNLFTKKGRTLLTSFAGSIGIIGIALIYAVSQGATNYINTVQEETLTAYPLTLEAESIELSTLIESFMGKASDDVHENDAVYSRSMIYQLINTLNTIEKTENDLASFKTYLTNRLADEDDTSGLREAVSGIQYSYNLNMQLYTENVDGKILHSDITELMTDIIAQYSGVSSEDMSSLSSSNPMMSLMTSSSSSSSSLWQEMLPGTDGSLINDVFENQYDLIYGSWPNDYNELVLVVNEQNELNDLVLYAMGLIPQEDIDEALAAMNEKREIEYSKKRFTYEEICGLEFRIILPSDCYTYDSEKGAYTDLRETDAGVRYLYSEGIPVKISGIIRVKEGAVTSIMSSAIGYTTKLTEYIVDRVNGSEIVKKQLEDTSADVITGLPFRASADSMTTAEKAAAFRTYIASLSTEEKAQRYTDIMSIPSDELIAASVSGMTAGMSRADLEEMMLSSISGQISVDEATLKNYLAGLSDEELKEALAEGIEETVRAQYAAQIAQQFASVPAEQLASFLDTSVSSYTEEQCADYYMDITEFSSSDYDTNLTTLGVVDLDSPATINLYASTFENKDVIEDAIADYNDSVEDIYRIKYTDYAGIIMSSVTTIINAITYVLIAFVAISLIVSSIMIGVITLISVQERTKEIGILRAIGASKSNVSSMFNAETVIIGFCSGLIGVLITYLLCIPINIILHSLTGINNLSADLPVPVAAVLVLISLLLTLVAGIIPSRSAAKKDPVVALRTE